MPELDLSRVSTANLLPVVVDGDYYGGSSAAVPFKWESQPGTPRQRLSTVSAPLTPPPSYFYASPSSTNPKRSSTNPKKSNVRFGSLVNKNRSDTSSPAASSSSSSSTTSSVPSSPLRTHDLYGRNSPGSLWSGSKHYSNAKFSGCYASIIKLFLRDVK